MNSQIAAIGNAPAAGSPPVMRAKQTATSPRYALHEAEDPVRRRVLERFVAERYASAYGARIRGFLPRLFALDDDSGRCLAAFGLRDATHERLFLETYLDQPIEQAIGERCDVDIARHQIVEIGNLAGRHAGALRILIPMLGEWLQTMGYHWLVFTGNTRLVNGFERLGIHLHALAPAGIERLPEAERADWGHYYDSAPVVLCADIAAGRSHLTAHPELIRRLQPPTIIEEAS